MMTVVLDKLNSTFAQIVRENKGVPLTPQEKDPDSIVMVILVAGVVAATILIISLAFFRICRHRR